MLKPLHLPDNDIVQPEQTETCQKSPHTKGLPGNDQCPEQIQKYQKWFIYKKHVPILFVTLQWTPMLGKVCPKTTRNMQRLKRATRKSPDQPQNARKHNEAASGLHSSERCVQGQKPQIHA